MDYQKIVYSIVGVSALLGLIIHVSVVGHPTLGLVNQYYGVWGASMLVITAIQCFYIQTKPVGFVKLNRSFYAEVFYLIVLILAYVITFFGLAVASAGDKGAGAGSAWSVLNIGLTSLALRICLSRRKSAGVSTEKKEGTDDIVSCKIRTSGYFNGFFRFLHLLFSFLLAAGAIVNAGLPKFPPPGTIYSLTMTDGRKADIHVYCSGPKNSSLPVIWISATAAHGVVDFYGVQGRLNDAGRRVCTFDSPGFGWSAPIQENQVDGVALWWKPMIEAANEQKPILFAGWGGAGRQVVTYTNAYPNDVKAVAFITVYPEDIEFLTVKEKNGWSDAQTKDYKYAQLKGRVSNTGIIMGLAIPWGLLPVFVPMASVAKGYEPEDKRVEFRSMLWKSNMWLNQYWALRDMVNTAKEDFSVGTLPSGVTLGHVYCKLNDSQICKKPSDPFCQNNIDQNKITLPLQYQLTITAKSDAQIIYDSSDDCTLDMPVAKPKFTADSILTMLGNITTT